MLDNSLWRQYHSTKSIHDTLVTIYGCEDFDITSDEKALYASIKRRLTKKELRAFIMKEATVSDSVICNTLHVNEDELELMLRKAYRKIRQDGMRNEASLNN